MYFFFNLFLWKVEKSESKGPKKPTQKLFIGNVADGTTDQVNPLLYLPFISQNGS